MTAFLDRLVLVAFVVLIQICAFSTAHLVPFAATKTPENNRPERQISPELFDSLGELARINDIAYCIGTTGVQKPFECLSHCREFQGFKLIDVRLHRPFLLTYSAKLMGS